MAENKTPIVIPEQADELEGVVAGAVKATGPAADQHIEPELPTQPAVDAVSNPVETGGPQPTPGTPGPLGDIISTH